MNDKSKTYNKIQRPHASGEKIIQALLLKKIW